MNYYNNYTKNDIINHKTHDLEIFAIKLNNYIRNIKIERDNLSDANSKIVKNYDLMKELYPEYMI